MSVATTPLGGLGISLGYNLGGSSTFASFGNLQDDCGFSGFDTTVIPIKPLSQTVVTKVPGRIDPGTFDGTLYLVPGDPTVIEMQTLQANRTMVAWILTMKDGTSPTTGTTYTFSGFVANVAPAGFNGDDAPTLGFSIAVSGAVSCTVGS